tara:strand:- start:28 stop:264 length:237 start_codon:yes stop_codon:yes gene_type:complete
MANIYSFSLPNKDKHLMEKIDELATQFDCSNSVLIKRALKSFCGESIIDPVLLRKICSENPNILNQVKRIVNEVENSA